MTDFDPAEHSAKEVIAHVEEHPDEAEAIAAAEAEGKDRSTVAAAAEEAAARPRRSAKREPKTGTYVLQPGDNPAVVARNLLGRGSHAGAIVAANPGVKWRPGVEITLPEVD